MRNRETKCLAPLPLTPVPVQMGPNLGPPFSSYNMIKKPGSSANATSAIATSVRSQDLYQEGHSLANVTEVMG
ncbi:hypothetical protein AMTR_s00001p00272710 [Amborella trichopoda]|uniref:Uncharacterized protein n=1 Tax=Amborella trichopoda TaxID=13333 RepID=W1NMI3_AMBTC|nr:hypothetical protein AMTR_s00001p00272710 [Amborella trichopoda]